MACMRAVLAQANVSTKEDIADIKSLLEEQSRRMDELEDRQDKDHERLEDVEDDIKKLKSDLAELIESQTKMEQRGDIGPVAT